MLINVLSDRSALGQAVKHQLVAKTKRSERTFIVINILFSSTVAKFITAFDTFPVISETNSCLFVNLSQTLWYQFL